MQECGLMMTASDSASTGRTVDLVHVLDALHALNVRGVSGASEARVRNMLTGVLCVPATIWQVEHILCAAEVCGFAEEVSGNHRWAITSIGVRTLHALVAGPIGKDKE